MKNWTLLLVLMTVFPLFAAAQTASHPITVTFNPGLELSYQSIASLVGTEETENTCTILASRLAVRMDIFEYLSMEVLAGYHFAHARDPLDFTALPLSLRWERQKFQGLLLGAALISEPLSFGDFSLQLRGEFTLAMEKGRTWEIELPQVSGQATGDNTFSLLTLDATWHYLGLTGVTLFIGPRLNLLRGKFSAAESIADLEGEQEFTYRQKNLVGALAGLTVEIGDNWELTLKAGLLARTEFSLAVYYVF